MDKPKSLFAKLRKFFLIALVIGFVLLYVGLTAGEIVAKKQVLAQLNERFGGTANVEKLNISMFCAVSLEGLHATDSNGDVVLELESMHASISPLSLLAVYPELDAKVEGFELTLRQLPDESWNYEGWSGDEAPDEKEPAKDSEPKDDSEPKQDDDSGKPESVDQLPFFGKLAMDTSRIILIANDGTTSIEDLRVSGGVEQGETQVLLNVDADLKASKKLRKEGNLQELVGLHGDVSGDLNRGPEEADWLFNMSVTNGDGALQLAGTVSPAVLLGSNASIVEKQGLSVKFDAKSIGLSEQIIPLLAKVHPIFDAASGLDTSGIGGFLDGSLNLNFRGALGDFDDPMAAVGPILGALSGGGSLSIDGVGLGDTKLIQSMFDYLGVEDKNLNLDRLSFDFKDGRLNYAEGWGWDLGGVQTNFGGSVGLDGKLDLTWNAPVTDKLIKKYSFLKGLKGKNIGIPVGGSMSSPVFDFQSALKGAGGDAAENLALEKLGLEEVPALNDLGGLAKDKLGIGGSKDDDDDPKKLYKQAGKLWEAGDKAAAAKLYKRIRSDHKLSITYTLNRDKIKKRSKYKD